MRAKLIYKSKFIYKDGFIREMVLWQLPQRTKERAHSLKYRLYYGDHTGKCLVRYDNETGKGDHKHIGYKEIIYNFETVEKLINDFLNDIKNFRRRNIK